jgi:hypothetical protein
LDSKGIASRTVGDLADEWAASDDAKKLVRKGADIDALQAAAVEAAVMFRGHP